MVSNQRIEEILAYLDENGEEKALANFGITLDTLRRYQRKTRYKDTKRAKILLIDIETAPLHGNFWSLGKQYISPEQIETDSFIIGYSAKWLLSADMMSDFCVPKEAVARDDKRVTLSAYQLVNEADIIIGHNVEAFDIPILKSAWLLHGFNPPLPYQMVDTLKAARKEFRFASNKLNYLGQIMLSKEKLKTDRTLWARCEKGDQEALKYMEEYCRRDTMLLEEVFLEMRGWIKSFPNMGLLMDAEEQCCPNCGSFDIELTDKYYTTPANQYRVVRCKSCGAPNRLPRSIIDTTTRRNLIRSIAR
jgi:DNA polymerase elongation subunit (family B)